MTTTRRALLVLAAASLVLVLLRADGQSQTLFDEVEPSWSDAAYLGVVIPLDIVLPLLPVSPSPDQSPLAMDIATQSRLVWDDTETAAMISDVTLVSLLGTSLVCAPLFEWSVDESELSATLVAVEALATTFLATSVFKHLTHRQRPAAFAERRPDSYDSFFSGHTSMTFASATLLSVYAYEYDWLTDGTRWLIPTTTFLLAGFTGYLRIAGDRHWLTDVLVGALVGTGTSYLVFALRTGR